MSFKSPIGRSRLGKGIGALLSGSGEDTPTSVPPTLSLPAEERQTSAKVGLASDDIRRLPVEAIAVNPFQPRRQFNDESLQELSESLKANGLVQPIVVASIEGRYELIAGERRLRAAKLAGLTDVPVVVRQVDSRLQARLALVENIHREDLNAIDRAEGYRALMTTEQITQAELATSLGEQRSTIANHLRLLELPQAIQDRVRRSELSLGHAKILAGISPEERQTTLAEQCVTEQWSVRELEAQAANSTPLTAKPVTPRLNPASAHIQDLATQLSRALSVRVQVQPAAKKGTGRVVLHYANLDQFDALLTQLGVKLDEA